MISDQVQAKRLISDVLSRHARLDVLVNNAGINAMIPHGWLKDASPEIWRRLYEVNVIAPWTLIAEAEQALRDASTQECPSSIVNTAHMQVYAPKVLRFPMLRVNPLLII
jgi:NAD(P)-dependent dehydrogenase (short-subunit alcohol dehydrogenase family)